MLLCNMDNQDYQKLLQYLKNLTFQEEDYEKVLSHFEKILLAKHDEGYQRICQNLFLMLTKRVNETE